MSVIKPFLLVLLFSALAAAPSWAAGGTYTAASCSQSAVNAVINGPTHIAVDGDTINIPAGSCTWTSALVVPSGIGISILGGGTPNSTPSTNSADASCTATKITADMSSGSMFTFSPHYGNSLTRISCMEMLPTSPNPGYNSPVSVLGTCTTSGCPNLRIDNLTVPSAWSSVNLSDASFAIVVNMFGVADHNTVGDVPGAGNGVDFINISHASWQGVGSYGDKSWASPDTLGTQQQFYLENNTFNYSFGTDSDTNVGTGGGGRSACRFNSFSNVTGASACTNHGTETTGRPRGGRQMEAYGNTVSCSNTSQGCSSGFGMRSGVGIVFGNTYSAASGAWYNQYLAFTAERAFRPTPWGFCDGAAPYDVNDGATVAYTGVISAFSGGVLSVSGGPWTAGAYAFSSTSPGSIYYTVYDTTSGANAGITSNTSSALTLSWQLSSITNTGAFTPGDSFIILGSTLYAAGTMTGSSGNVSILTDSAKSWTTNRWAGYSVLDVSQGYAGQIISNTATTLTFYIAPSTSPGGTWPGWHSGDAYVIMRATRCLDQPSASGGQLYSSFVATPATATSEVMDPSYEFAETGHTPNHGYVNSQTLTVQADRDYYVQVSQSQQSSPTSPFNGSTGTGYGTLANRPTTCTPHVGYWATDQGTWNQSGNQFGQGQLFVCSATNTWTAYYTPYAYPHPLTQGIVATQGSGGSGSPAAPTNTGVTVQ